MNRHILKLILFMFTVLFSLYVGVTGRHTLLPYTLLLLGVCFTIVTIENFRNKAHLKGSFLTIVTLLIFGVSLSNLLFR